MIGIKRNSLCEIKQIKLSEKELIKHVNEKLKLKYSCSKKLGGNYEYQVSSARK